MFETAAGQGRVQVQFKARRVGHDWCVHITGGKAHIGAVALGVMDQLSGHASVSLLTVPGHKEGAWAYEFAERLVRRLRQTVLVTVGIHLDQIRKSEIRRLKLNVDRSVKEFLSV